MEIIIVKKCLWIDNNINAIFREIISSICEKEGEKKIKSLFEIGIYNDLIPMLLSSLLKGTSSRRLFLFSLHLHVRHVTRITAVVRIGRAFTPRDGPVNKREGPRTMMMRNNAEKAMMKRSGLPLHEEVSHVS